MALHAYGIVNTSFDFKWGNIFLGVIYRLSQFTLHLFCKAFYGCMVGTTVRQVVLLVLPAEAESLVKFKNLVDVSFRQGTVFHDGLAAAEFPKVEIGLCEFQQVVRLVSGIHPTLCRIHVGVVDIVFVGRISYFLLVNPWTCMIGYLKGKRVLCGIRSLEVIPRQRSVFPGHHTLRVCLGISLNTATCYNPTDGCSHKHLSHLDNFKKYRKLFQAYLVAKGELEDTVFNTIIFENVRQAQVVATIEDSPAKTQAEAHRYGQVEAIRFDIYS